MAVRIRLRRMGRKKKPQYRVVVTDKASPRDGRFVETLGHYKPLTEPARLVIDLERVDYWIEQGAVPSETVRTLIRKARSGGSDRLAVGEVDVEAEKAQKAEALAAKRKTEAELAASSAKAEAAPEAAPEDVEAEADEAEVAAEAAEQAEETAAKGEADAGAAAEADAAAKAEAEAKEGSAEEAEDASADDADSDEEAEKKD